MIKNIGLIGKMGSGKDTVADVLVSTAGYVPMAFATPLKEMVIECDPLVMYRSTSMYADEAVPVHLSDLLDSGHSFEHCKREYPEVRRTLQRIGQGVRRQDPEYWIRSLFERTGDIPMSKRIVVTDVRYRNEADALREAGYALIRLDRPMNPDGYTMAETRAMMHQSEIDLDGYTADFTIKNDSTKNDLVLKVLDLFV